MVYDVLLLKSNIIKCVLLGMMLTKGSLDSYIIDDSGPW